MICVPGIAGEPDWGSGINLVISSVGQPFKICQIRRCPVMMSADQRPLLTDLVLSEPHFYFPRVIFG